LILQEASEVANNRALPVKSRFLRKPRILNKDYTEVGDEELKKIKAVLTVVDGTIIHNKLST
jgi:hypothetical protein